MKAQYNDGGMSRMFVCFTNLSQQVKCLNKPNKQGIIFWTSFEFFACTASRQTEATGISFKTDFTV